MVNRILVDTNVLLDYLLIREPFYEDAGYIVTRNLSDYKTSEIQAILPRDYLEL